MPTAEEAVLLEKLHKARLRDLSMCHLLGFVEGALQCWILDGHNEPTIQQLLDKVKEFNNAQ